MYEAGTGMPVIATGSGDGFLGGGGALGGLILGALFSGGFGGFGGRGVAGADLAATAGLQNQINGLSNQISSIGTGSELNEIESSIESANIANLQGIGQNALLYVQGNGALATQIANGNFTTLQSLNAQNLSTLNSFNNLTTTMLQSANEIGRDMQTGFNQLIMGQNTLAAQMASCCCDIKSAIHADGEATRALINANTITDLENRLNIANQALQTQTIINSLKPTTVTA